MKNLKRCKFYLRSMFATLVVGYLALVGSQIGARSAENVTIAIISFSPYAPWYIVKERGLAKDIDLDIRIIEDITAKNAGLTSGRVHCMMNTLDSVVVARSADVPVKVIAVPAMSYGLDEMVVAEDIKAVSDFPGKSYGADYGFLNHMWMLLTLKKAGIDIKELTHKVMLPQDSAAAFVSGGLDIDVNYKPFTTQSLERAGAHVLKTSLSDRTWERGLISEAIACNSDWLAKNQDVAQELLRAWFEAVDWWKRNPDEGNKLVAAGLDWPMSDVKLTQYGAIMLTLDQNLGAFGLGGGKPVCASLPADAPKPPAEPSNWGKLLFGGGADCDAGYLSHTWNLFGTVYKESGVTENVVDASKGLDASLLEALAKAGFQKKYNSNEWIGRLGL